MKKKEGNEMGLGEAFFLIDFLVLTDSPILQQFSFRLEKIEKGDDRWW